MKYGSYFLIAALSLIVTISASADTKDRVIISGPDQQELYIGQPDSAVYIGEPEPELEVKGQSIFATQALSLMSGCTKADYSGKSGGAAIELDGLFVFIPVRSKNLPPLPSDRDGKRTIAGIDVDKDCVRDDIMHYIHKRFPKKSDAKIRNYFGNYAVMMGFALLNGLSRKTALKIYLEKASIFTCIERERRGLNLNHEITELSAHFHNTYPRLKKKVANESLTGGAILSAEDYSAAQSACL